MTAAQLKNLKERIALNYRLDTDGGCSCHINPPCSYCMSLSEEDWADDQNKRFYSPTELRKKLSDGGFKEIKS